MRPKQMIILCVMLLALVSCSEPGVLPTAQTPPTPESSAEAQAEQVVIGLQGTLSGHSNLEQYEPATRLMHSLVHRALFKRDADMRIVPDLAESYRVERDDAGRRIWYIRLRADETFSDGSPLSAEDVIASLQAAQTQQLSDSFTDSWQEARAVNASEIALLESEQDNSLLYDLSLPTAYILKAQQVSREDFSTALGLGDYTLGHLSDQEAVLERRPDAPTAMERIILKVYSDESSGLLHLEQGVLDVWLAPSAPLFAALEHQAELQYVSVPSVTQTWLGFNTEIWPFNEPNVRLAINAALNKPKLLQVALGGDGLVSAHVDPWQNLENVQNAQPDLELARALLRKAGVRASSVRLDILTTDPQKLLMYEVIKDDLEALGMRVNAVSMDFATYVQTLRQGDFKAYIGGYTLGQPEVFLKDMFASANIGSTNVARFKDRNVDALLAEIRLAEENDTDFDRALLTAELQTSMPYVPLFQSMHHLIHHKDLTGMVLRADGTIDPGQWQWKH